MNNVNVVYKYGQRYIESDDADYDLRTLLDMDDRGDEYDEQKQRPIVKWAGELLNDRGVYGGVKPDEVLVSDDALTEILRGVHITEDEQEELKDARRDDRDYRYYYDYTDISRVACNVNNGELKTVLDNIIEDTLAK